MKKEIEKKCDQIKEMLKLKNDSYGNSVFDRGVLFDVDPMYAMQARINDKLNRIKNKDTYFSENDLMDLTGYLILLQIYIEINQKSTSKSKQDIYNYYNTSRWVGCRYLQRLLIILLKSLPIIIYFDNNLLSLLEPLFGSHTRTKLARLPSL